MTHQELFTEFFDFVFDQGLKYRDSNISQGKFCSDFLQLAARHCAMCAVGATEMPTEQIVDEMIGMFANRLDREVEVELSRLQQN